ncbi:hypothetical protein [Sphingomonas segetis]|uniref:hypothetical protein n=1 Tax=Sphingomonas segetis TaxID=1104779 RepID=UPI0012D328B1|nr:hypothetical protein [Sphingomonas segetis]
MRIEGSVRSNLLAAIASARRLRGRPVHQDTVEHWRRLADHGRGGNGQPHGEMVGDLVAQLETELRLVTGPKPRAGQIHSRMK